MQINANIGGVLAIQGVSGPQPGKPSKCPMMAVSPGRTWTVGGRSVLQIEASEKDKAPHRLIPDRVTAKRGLGAPTDWSPFSTVPWPTLSVSPPSADGSSIFTFIPLFLYLRCHCYSFTNMLGPTQDQKKMDIGCRFRLISKNQHRMIAWA